MKEGGPTKFNSRKQQIENFLKKDIENTSKKIEEKGIFNKDVFSSMINKLSREYRFPVGLKVENGGQTVKPETTETEKEGYNLPLNKEVDPNYGENENSPIIPEKTLVESLLDKLSKGGHPINPQNLLAKFFEEINEKYNANGGIPKSAEPEINQLWWKLRDKVLTDDGKFNHNIIASDENENVNFENVKEGTSLYAFKIPSVWAANNYYEYKIKPRIERNERAQKIIKEVLDGVPLKKERFFGLIGDNSNWRATENLLDKMDEKGKHLTDLDTKTLKNLSLRGLTAHAIKNPFVIAGLYKVGKIAVKSWWNITKFQIKTFFKSIFHLSGLSDDEDFKHLQSEWEKNKENTVVKWIRDFFNKPLKD